MSVLNGFYGFLGKLWNSTLFRQTFATLILIFVTVAMIYMALTQWEGFAAFALALGKLLTVVAVYLLIDHFVIHPETNTRDEIQKGNLAVSVFAGMVFLGLCVLIANS